MERKKFLPADAISRFWKDRSVTQDRPLIPPRPLDYPFFYQGY